jgi:hypothetical protein
MGFAATATHLGSGFGRVGSLARCRKLGNNHLVNQGNIDRNIKDFSG